MNDPTPVYMGAALIEFFITEKRWHEIRRGKHWLIWRELKEENGSEYYHILCIHVLNAQKIKMHYKKFLKLNLDLSTSLSNQYT